MNPTMGLKQQDNQSPLTTFPSISNYVNTNGMHELTGFRQHRIPTASLSVEQPETVVFLTTVFAG